MDFTGKAKDLQQQIAKWQQDLHRIPELDLDLPKTREYILGVLQELGIEDVKTFENHSGIVALIRGGKPGPVIGLRSDMDALPVTEESGLSYASDNGCMHACGHDGHMAMLLGTAKLLWEQKEELAGTVKLIFQPAEESVGGAALMIEDGVMEDPKVDVIFGQHCGDLIPGYPAGTVAVKKNAVMASRDNFTITVTGKGGHSASPAQAVDPIVIAAQIITTMQTLVSRECNGNDCAVLTVGNLHSGDVFNVIPEKAVMQGAFRCLDPKIQEQIIRRLPELAAGIARAMGGDAVTEYARSYPVLINDPSVSDFVLKEAAQVFGEDLAAELGEATMISEDMSEYLNVCPGAFWFFTTPPAEGPRYPHHNPRFSIDSNMLWQGSAFMAQCAWDYPETAETTQGLPL